MTKQIHIVILGGGFGGISAAREIDRHISSLANVRATLVNRDNVFLYTPLIHEVVSSHISINNMVHATRRLLKHVESLNGEVIAIDLDGRKIEVCHGSDHCHVIEFDHLVIALGGITNTYDIPGLKEHALPLRSLGDALYIRSRLINNLEDAEFTCCKDEKYLTCLVAGGGFAGVQTAASIYDALSIAVKEFKNLNPQELRVVNLDWRSDFLPGLSQSLKDYARKKLTERGIEIISGVGIESYDGNTVTLSDGQRIITGTVIWTAGHSPNPLIDTLDCRKRDGRIMVDYYLEVPNHPGVWAIGDSVSIIDPETGKPYFPIPQHSAREGVTAARNIIAAISGRSKRQFRVTTLPQAAQIGRHSAVTEILGRNFSGFIPWFFWRSIHLDNLPGFQKKLRVALDWALNLLFSRDFVQEPILTIEQGYHLHGQVAREECYPDNN